MPNSNPHSLMFHRPIKQLRGFSAPQAPKVTPPDEILIRWEKNSKKKLDRHLYKGGEPIGESVA